MNEPNADEPAFVVGLRLDPETEIADWYTLWRVVDTDKTPVINVDGRVQWWRTREDARAQSDIDFNAAFTADSELADVCDVALTMFAVSSGDPKNETAALDSLNLLDDLLLSIRPRLELPNERVLDVLTTLLFEGESLASAVQQVGGEDAVVEPILASLGRVFALSTFRG